MRLVVNATAYGDPPGGAGLRARRLFGALEGHELLFLLAEDTPPEVVPPGAETRRLPVRAGRPFERWRRLRLPDEGDLLFTDHYPVAPVPTVITLHDRGKSAWRRRLVARHLPRAAAIVAVSRTVARAWETACTAAPRTFVVPNGVAVPERARGAPGAHLLCCDPGLAHKGAAIARRVATALGLELCEVGRGVRWLDHDELLQELARAAVVLCPAREEGFGMVPLEAMALGRPVVVSDIDAHREVCGAHAFYATDDPASWRSATEAALACGDERRARARAHALAWSWEAAAAALADVIRYATRM